MSEFFTAHDPRQERPAHRRLAVPSLSRGARLSTACRGVECQRSRRRDRADGHCRGPRQSVPAPGQLRPVQGYANCQRGRVRPRRMGGQEHRARVGRYALADKEQFPWIKV